ncbi:MAG: hypothetical protein HY662_03105 [Chloroflexi bacterium]|nr:hypothetical protein [Chloroflexota bacterium]
MEASKIAEAQASLAALFSQLGIKRIVFVDDEFRLDFEQASGIFAIADQQELTKIDVLQRITFTDDAEINLANFRRLWETLDDSQKHDLFARLPRRSELPKPDEKSAALLSLDYIVVPVLHDIFKGIPDIDYRELSLTEWKRDGSRLLDEAKTNKTIFFFDQDLSKEGGSDREGITQIQDTLRKASEKDSQVICGLLSHTFTPAQAYDEWKKFAKENNINESQFILVAKSEIDDLASFVHMIKLMVLNGPCNTLILSVSSAIEQAHLKAKGKIEEINVFDFDHIVFRSSHHEGVWELDTLIRLFGIFQRDIIRETVGIDAGVNQSLERIRKISNIKSNPPAFYRGKSWQIQRCELYESGDHINKFHLPLELGDIFQNSAGTKKYIVVAQPCDLMIRLEGDTPGKRRPSVNVATLADIVLDKPRDPNAYYELPFFDEETGKSWYVRFTSTHATDILVLDMCVFQPDGMSKFVINQECPSCVIPAWQLRHKNVKEDLTKEIQLYLELKAKIDSPQLNDLVFRSSVDRIFKAKIDDSVKGKETLNYTCQRVSRLCEPRASAMLTAYANYVCRAAFEHNFGEPPQTP